MIRNKHTLTCAFVGALLFGGCAPSHARQTTTPSPDYDPTQGPLLCDIDDGRWCTPCVDGSTCPQEDSGWLCCSGGACIPNVAQDDCNGVWGWCSNYSTSQACTEDGYCTTKAECHDA